jgi:glycosyltransferase 2 family protein
MVIDAFHLLSSSAMALAGRLAGVSLALLGAALLLHVGKLAGRARAWQNIVRVAYPAERLRYRQSLGAYLCGIGVNAVLPARPGELVKLALVKRKAPGTRYRGLVSTLLTESAFDTVVGGAALGFAVAVGWTSLGGSLASLLGPLAAHPWLAGAAALSVGIVVGLMRRPLNGRLRRVVAEASCGFTVFGRPRRYLGTVVSWQLAALIFRLASIHCFLAAFHLPAGIRTTLLVLAVQSAASLIPLTPNGAGTQQALLVLALGTGAGAPSIVRFGVGAQLATAAAEVSLALVSLALMTGSLRWRQLLTATSEVTPATRDDPDQPVGLPLPSAA